MCNRFLVLVAILFATVAIAQDPAAIQYKVNPDVNAKINTRTNIFPTCRPTVTTAHSAFMCFMDNDGNNFVQYVDPTNPTTSYAQYRVEAPPAGTFKQSPIALSPYTTIVDSSNQEYSFWAMASSVQLFHEHDRKNSTASVAYNPDDKIAYIPFGRTHMNFADSITALDVTSVTDKVLWVEDFPFPNGFQGTSLMGTPIYYDGAVFLMQQNTLYKLNATKAPAGKKQILWQIPDPCDIKPAAGAQVQLNVVTFSKDFNGNLDAFILVANTTVAGKTETTVCRISHHDGQKEWPEAKTYNKDIEIHDVSAGNKIIFISGRILGLSYANSHVILGVSAETGAHMFTVNRAPQDRRSFPLTVQEEVEGCKGLGTFVAQKNGKLTAFCSTDAKQQWVSTGACNAHPTSVAIMIDNKPVEHLACTELQKSVHLIQASNGNVLWSNKIEAIFAPSYIDGLVWATDVDGWLYGMVPGKILTDAPTTESPTTDSPKGSPTGDHNNDDKHKGLSAGTIVLILFVCAFIIGVGGGLAFSWVKRSRRRTGYQAELDENGYGSLSS